MTSFFSPYQYGINMSNGCEIINHSIDKALMRSYRKIGRNLNKVKTGKKKVLYKEMVYRICQRKLEEPK